MCACDKKSGQNFISFWGMKLQPGLSAEYDGMPK